MEKILVGKFVKTHGIKGEIKVRSHFKYKERVFSLNNKIFLGDQEFIITGYRKHQDYDMLTFKGIQDINQILSLKGSLVYALKETLHLKETEYLDDDFINLNVYQKDQLVGEVMDIVYINETKKLLALKEKYIPFELIKKVDLKKKRIEIEEVEGLL